MRKQKAEPIAAELVVSTGAVRVPAEIVPSNANEFKKAIARLVEQKVAEALRGEDAIFEPFFQPKAIAGEFRKRQTVQEQKKWSHYFEEWGCMICESKKGRHEALGMCSPCHTRTYQRLLATLRRTAPPEQSFQPGFSDTVRLAREALAPSIKALSAKNAKRGRSK
jgi:hypothetical protein